MVFKCREYGIYRSSRPEVFCKKGVLRNFAKFTGKHLCQSLFFIKVAGLHFVKKETLSQVFPVNFVKFLRAPFLLNTSGGCLCIYKKCEKNNESKYIVIL